MERYRARGQTDPTGISRRTLLGGGAAILGAAAVPGMASSAAAAAGDTIVVRWSQVAQEALRQGTLGPPMVARAHAILHTCIYDAWAAYDTLASGTRLGGTLRRPFSERTEANKTEAINYAAHSAARDLFPWYAAEVNQFLRSVGGDPNHYPTDNSPAGIGRRAAAAALDFRHSDGSNQLNGYADTTGYAPVNDPMVVSQPIDPATVRVPDRWQPLTYRNRSGKLITPKWIGPHWYQVKPFSLLAGNQFRHLLGPVAKWGTPAFQLQCDDLLTTQANLTDRQKVIAEYFADGPASEQPPGHWQLFAQFVSRRDHHTLDQDVKLFFLTTNAVFDAGIAAWDGKRAFDSVRPITGIRLLYRGKPITAWAGPGQGTGTIDGGTWVPYQPTWFPTPPFGEYPSGHSTFSAAAAQVLALFTGSDRFGYSTTIRAGTSFVEPGFVPATDVTLTYPTFSAAADDAGISRRYGGIHFVQGDLDARLLGREVGLSVWTKATTYFLGLG
ncbi:MAG: vanadium-dependent haloperoxidase [Micromonosporaceae bacterium]